MEVAGTTAGTAAQADPKLERSRRRRQRAKSESVCGVDAAQALFSVQEQELPRGLGRNLDHATDGDTDLEVASSHLAMVVADRREGEDSDDSNDGDDPSKLAAKATDTYNSAARHLLLALECRAALVAQPLPGRRDESSASATDS